MANSNAIIATIIISALASAVSLRWTTRVLSDWRLTRRLSGRRVVSGAGLALVPAVALTLVTAHVVGPTALTGPFASVQLLGIILAAAVGVAAELAGGHDGTGLFSRPSRPPKGRERVALWVKGIGMALTAWWVAHLLGADGLRETIAGGAFVFLSAHILSRVNERPGRTLKLYWALCVALLLCADSVTALRAAPVLIASLVLGPHDLTGRALLGDIGALVLGTSLGTMVIGAVASPAIHALALAVLVVGTLGLEWRPMSRLVDSVPALRVIDRLGVRGPAAGPDRR